MSSEEIKKIVEPLRPAIVALVREAVDQVLAEKRQAADTVSMTEAAELLGVSRRTIQNYRDELGARKIPGQGVRIPRQNVVDWGRRGYVGADPLEMEWRQA
jgi:excisionase family DNA binding protein